MIHYHGTPMGGPRQDVVRFMMGRHALIPFDRPEDVAGCAEVCQSFIFDNSAFTKWKQGGVIDVPEYAAWCHEWHKHPGFDWALIPDVIDGNESENDAMIAQWPRNIRGVPVWHMHESINRLATLCAAWPIVALGSSGQFAQVGKQGWWNRMHKAMAAICDEKGRPPCRLHGLRMMDPAIFGKLPLSSADSTNAAQNSGSTSRFGIYTPPTSAQRAAVIAERIEAFNSAPIWEENAKTEELIFSE